MNEFSLRRRSRARRSALVGPSGAGKSTVFQLLLRFYDTQAGTVSIDGVDVRTTSLAELRSRIGIVPQDSTVFSANALENIRYGRPDTPRTTRSVAAARAAYADEFITRPAQRATRLFSASAGGACRQASASASRSHARC